MWCGESGDGEWWWGVLMGSADVAPLMSRKVGGMVMMKMMKWGEGKVVFYWVNFCSASFVPVDKDEPSKERKSTPDGVGTYRFVSCKPYCLTYFAITASKFKGASTAEKCGACGKTVYLTERIVIEDKEDKQTFHKSCLKCNHCGVYILSFLRSLLIFWF